MAAPKHLRIGVFIPKGCQLLDMSGVDLFAMLSPSYLRACSLPTPLIALGTPNTIHYISVPSTGTHVELTGSVFLKVTNTVYDKEVQPGMLDILLVPGPDPSLVFDEEVLSFLRAHMQWQGADGRKEDVLSVCTGCFLLAQSGVLKGKKANGPRALVPELRKKFPEAEWIDDKRWVNDGNLWMSGTFPCSESSVCLIS
jgi:transcriptional regulator GlxA family with amidase domain